MPRSGLDGRDAVGVGHANDAAALLLPPGPVPARVPSALAERALGSTGEQVRLVGLGGQGLLEQSGRQVEAQALIARALDLGVNFIETSPAYGNGRSQQNLGAVLATRRADVFLAGRTHDRSRDGSLRLLERSLEQLRTDHLDLWQLHDPRSAGELDAMFGRGGAVEALCRARAEKLVRFVGIAGHSDPALLLEALRRYDFDTVLMGMNPADRHFGTLQHRVLPEANRRRMGVIAAAPPPGGRGVLTGSACGTDAVLQYLLSQPVSTVLLGCGSQAELELCVALATSFRQLTSAELAHMETLNQPDARR